MKRKLLAAFICCASLQLAAQNLVPNPQFETTTPSTADYSYYNPSMQCHTAPCNTNLFRLSPAQYWTMWLGTSQNYACVMAELVKAGSNCVPLNPNYVMGNMMHIKTTVGSSGIVNINIAAGKSRVKVSCWVYVVKGTFYLGYGPTGNPLVSKLSTTRCKWEYVEVVYDGSKGEANQVILYASNNGDAEFYVDAVSVIRF